MKTSKYISSKREGEIVNKHKSDFLIVDLIFHSAGDPVGFFSAPLNQIAGNIQENLNWGDYLNYLTWIDLSPAKYLVM